MMSVVDREGRVVEVDGDVVPEGCSLRVPASFMDGAERAAIEGLRRRHPGKTEEQLDAEIERLDAEIERLDAEIAELDGEDGDDHEDADRLTPSERAYLNAKDQLHYANRRKRWSTPLKAPTSTVPSSPSWQRSPWKPNRGRVEVGGAPDSAPKPGPSGSGFGSAAKDAAAAARKAYAARSRYLQDAWRRKAGKPALGPYFPTGDAARVVTKPTVSADWAAAHVPAVGGTGSPSPARRLSDGAAAWRRMVDDLGTRWRTHRKPFVPGDPA